MVEEKKNLGAERVKLGVENVMIINEIPTAISSTSNS